MGSFFLVNQTNASRNPTAVTIKTCHSAARLVPPWVWREGWVPKFFLSFFSHCVPHRKKPIDTCTYLCKSPYLCWVGRIIGIFHTGCWCQGLYSTGPGMEPAVGHRGPAGTWQSPNHSETAFVRNNTRCTQPGKLEPDSGLMCWKKITGIVEKLLLQPPWLTPDYRYGFAGIAHLWKWNVELAF